MNFSCKVNPKGQITIPSDIRKKLEINENDILMAKVTEEGFILLEGKPKKISKDKDMLFHILEETFASLKKREEGHSNEDKTS